MWGRYVSVTIVDPPGLIEKKKKKATLSPGAVSYKYC